MIGEMMVIESDGSICDGGHDSDYSTVVDD